MVRARQNEFGSGIDDTRTIRGILWMSLRDWPSRLCFGPSLLVCGLEQGHGFG